MKKYLALLVAAGAAYYFYRKYSVGRNARFYFKSVAVKNKKLQLNIAAQNPTSSTIKLNSLAGEVFANNKLVSNVSTFTPVTIPGNTETVLSFTVVPNVGGVINLVSSVIKSLVKKQKIGLNVRLEGTANVDGMALPLNLTYNV